jgi:hypothetical protein
MIAIKGTKAKTETPANKIAFVFPPNSLAIKQQSTSIPTPASVEKNRTPDSE